MRNQEMNETRTFVLTILCKHTGAGLLGAG